MPVASAIAEMSFSVLRRLKTYVRSTMKNDRLCSLGLMHINRDFEVDLYKAMESVVGQIITFSNDPVGSTSGYFSPEIL
jgi:hypothetical protein